MEINLIFYNILLMQNLLMVDLVLLRIKNVLIERIHIHDEFVNPTIQKGKRVLVEKES